MPLSPGTRVGPYEVVAALGRGGMGEVFRARDTELRREVALKVLPDVFAADLDRLSRFEREAQILASLNHPNIAAIYGFAAVNGGHALVLELVDGPTLVIAFQRDHCHCKRPSRSRVRYARRSTPRTSVASSTGISNRRISS